MNEPAKKRSGEHPAVVEYRRKLDSIGEQQIPQLAALNRRVDRLKKRASSSSNPPRGADPRREDNDERAENEHDVDIVDLDAE